jgi:hypothetical protein
LFDKARKGIDRSLQEKRREPSGRESTAAAMSGLSLQPTASHFIVGRHDKTRPAALLQAQNAQLMPPRVAAGSGKIVASETIFHNSEIRRHSENDLVRHRPKVGWTWMQEVESKITAQRHFHSTFGNIVIGYSPDARSRTLHARLRAALNQEEGL